MLTQIINGKIFTPNGWLEGGSLILSDSKILEIANSDLPRVGATIVAHKKQKHILYATGGGLYENTFKDIKSMLDINACIGSIARVYVGDKPYHILNANFNKFYTTWQDYVDAELNR